MAIVFLLGISTFFLAAGGILYEIYLGAFGSYLFGDSVKVFSITTGVYMFSMGVGAFSIRPKERNPSLQLIYTELALMALHLVSPFVIWESFIRGWGAAPLFWMVLIFSGTLVGTEIPLILDIARDKEGTSDARVHQVLAADYAGALCASMAFGLFLLPSVGLIGSAAVAALTEGVGAVILLLGLLNRSRRKTKFLGTALLLSLLVSLWVLFHSDQIQRKLEQQWVGTVMNGGKVEHSEWTGFSHLTLVAYHHPLWNTEEHALLLDRQYQWSTGKDLPYYHEMLTVPIAESFRNMSGKEPKRALILGGGDGFVAEKLRSLYRIHDITLVDIDSRISSLARTTPFWRALGGWVFDDPALHLVQADAFQYVTRNPNTDPPFDLVVMDLPDPRSAALARFYTPSFFSHLKALLSDHGEIAIQSSTDAKSSSGKVRYACSLLQSLHAVGFHTQVLIGGTKDFYVLASQTGFAWPKNEAKLPGQFYTRGAQIQNYLTDTFGWFGPGQCPPLAMNSILRPNLLDY